MDNRNLVLSLTFVVAILFGTGFASGIGVSQVYWEDNPLKMAPGESREIAFTIISDVGDEPADIIVEMINNGGVSSITSGESYSVASGSRNTQILMRVSVPSNAEIGTRYDVKFNLKPDNVQTADTVQLGLEYSIEFPVIVVDESQSSGEDFSYAPIFIIFVSLVVIGFIVFLVLKKKDASVVVSK